MNRYDSPSAEEHRDQAAGSVACAVVTVSDTRTLADDRSGAAIIELLEAAGHRLVARKIVPDEPTLLEAAVRELVSRADVSAILVTGGTGVAPRDQTPDTLARLFTKELPGYGELFRMLSFQEIGASAMMSRAMAGTARRKAIFVLPGSQNAVRLAMVRLIVPELPHVIQQVSK
jgi:molybdenum cofactor biosynthesis protein B